MTSAIFYILYCGAMNIRNSLLSFSIGLIIFEGLVLLLNKGACPLTGIARKYSSETAENFDIYLPIFLAKYNKQIFTTIFITGLLLVIFN